MTDTIRDEFLKLLSKPVVDIKAQVFYVYFDYPDFDVHIKSFTDHLKATGVKEENITSFDLTQDNPPSLDAKDVIMMFGGNEYHYMHHIRRLGLYDEIRKFIDKDGVYVGASAGSIIMGPTVDTQAWSMAENDMNMEDTSGFGYVDFTTVAHIEWRPNPEKAIKHHGETNEKMIYFTEKQAILVRDDGYRIIG